MFQLFKFSGRLTPRSYFRAAAWRIGLFIASIFIFPLFLYTLAHVYNCDRGGAGCGPLALMGGMAFKPLAFVLFVGSLVGISLRRARDAGLPAFAGLLVPLTVLADYNFGVYTGAPWSFAFATGALFRQAPLYFAFGMLCIVLLGLAPSARLWKSDSLRCVRPETWALGLIAAALAVAATLRLVLSMPELTLSLRPLFAHSPLGRLLYFAPYLMLAFAALSIIAIVRAKRTPPGEAIQYETSGPHMLSGQSRLATIIIICSGTILTLIAAKSGFGELWPSPILIAISIVPILLPTFVLYTLPQWAAWRFLSRPGIAAGTMIVVTLAPFALWTSSYSTARLGVDSKPTFPPLLGLRGWHREPNIRRKH